MRCVCVCVREEKKTTETAQISGIDSSEWNFGLLCLPRLFAKRKKVEQAHLFRMRYVDWFVIRSPAVGRFTFVAGNDRNGIG